MLDRPRILTLRTPQIGLGVCLASFPMLAVERFKVSREKMKKRSGPEVIAARAPWARLLMGARELAVQTLWPARLSLWVCSVQSCARRQDWV